MGIFSKLFFGSKLSKYKKEVKKINDFNDFVSKMTEEQIKNRISEIKLILQKEPKKINDFKFEVFAMTKEAAKRTINMMHFDCQLIGGSVLNEGMIAEMRTGEGKTLVATLPASLNALTGLGVHIISVNDYLIKRDCEWMGPIYNYLGLTVGYIVGTSTFEERRNAYNCDITYVTNNEIGFDYLKDNMKYSLDDMILTKRGLNYAIVDEVDSILIDEARTPLIISGETSEDVRLYIEIDKIVKKLEQKDYEIDEKNKQIQLTEIGNEKVDSMLKKAGLLDYKSDLYDIHSFSLLNHIMQSLRAHFLFKKEIDYMIKDKQVQIIDEFTGRIMSGRRYSEGLHQAIEAKERVEVQKENQSLASITYQNFFRMYKKLSGMTGTANTEAKEFFGVYNLRILEIPTNKKITREDLNDLIFITEKKKLEAIIKTVKETHEKGQPILIGTTNIKKSEELSSILTKEHLKHNVLNAKYHEQEAHIIAEAGRFKAITIATNMAGRGTDIALGGNVSQRLQNITNIEEIEKIIKEFEEERQLVLKAGGLFLIGSERYENRRIDNQLLGRAGRQGDPGKSQFFLSLEDNLLRLFGGEQMQNMMNMFKAKEDETMSHSMINKVVERSQKRIESMHYEMRKNILKYDDVVNEQRKSFLEQRLDFIKSFSSINYVKEMILDKNSEFLTDENIDLKFEFHRIYNIYIENQDYNLSHLNELSYNKIENKFNSFKKEITEHIIKEITLTTLDEKWRYYLLDIDHLRESVHLASYAQKDPLLEFQMKSYQLYTKMMNSFVEDLLIRLFRLEIEL